MNREKKDRLLKIIRQYEKEDTIVAFSGGVDSALLLKLFCEKSQEDHTRVYAVTIHTALHPNYEMELTKNMAQEMGAEHILLQGDEMKEAGIMENPADRCYRCKKYLYLKIIRLAEELKVSHIFEGTNEDDLHVYRPGIRAVKELGIHSPLADAGLTKKEVRALAQFYGLQSAGRASAPCLATRFPYNTLLTVEGMRRVEEGEEYLRSLGLYNVRLRVHGDSARIEIDLAGIPLLMKERERVVKRLKALGYRYITLDLEGFRSGSMDTGKKGMQDF